MRILGFTIKRTRRYPAVRGRFQEEELQALLQMAAGDVRREALEQVIQEALDELTELAARPENSQNPNLLMQTSGGLDGVMGLRERLRELWEAKAEITEEQDHASV